MTVPVSCHGINVYSVNWLKALPHLQQKLHSLAIEGDMKLAYASSARGLELRSSPDWLDLRLLHSAVIVSATCIVYSGIMAAVLHLELGLHPMLFILAHSTVLCYNNNGCVSTGSFANFSLSHRLPSVRKPPPPFLLRPRPLPKRKGQPDAEGKPNKHPPHLNSPTLLLLFGNADMILK